MVVTTKQNKPELKVPIDNNPIKQSHHIKYLGVLIDDSSVDRGGGGGAIAPPIGLPTKMQNKENTTFLAFLRLSFALD